MLTRGVACGIAVLVACATGGRSNGTSGDASNDGKKPVDAFVPLDANGCATQPCSILPQCGCGAAMACDVNVMTLMGTACRSVASPGHETDHCTSTANCDVGYVCLGATNASSCKKYCAADADCGSPRGQCVIDITNAGGMAIAGLPPVCSSNCDPTNTAAGGCASNMKCGLFTATHNATMHNIADCSPAGAGVQGAVCAGAGSGDDTLCAANFLCTTVTSGYNCRKICNKTANTGCVGAQTCLGFATPFKIPTPTGIEYGVCN